MPSLLSTSEFRGIDPPALRGLAQRARAIGETLIDRGREAGLLGRTRENTVVAAAGDRLEQLGTDVAGWVHHLVVRAAAIEIGQQVTRTASIVLDEISGPSDTTVHVRDRGSSFTSVAAVSGETMCSPVDLTEVATWFDLVLLRSEDEIAEDELQYASRLLELLSPVELAGLVRLIDALGHGAIEAARLGDLISTSAADVGALVVRLGAALDTRDPFAAAVAGHAVMRRPPHQLPSLIAELLAVPGRLGAVAWGSAVAADGTAIRADLDRLVTSILAGGDAAVVAAVAAELMLETRRPLGLVWLAELDRAIVSLVATDASAVLGAMSEGVDPEGRAVVPWIRRQLMQPAGPDRLRAVVAGLVGEHPTDARWFATTNAGRYDHAITSGYLAGALALAVRLEAAAAHETVSTLGRFAGFAETLAAVGTRVAAALDVILPGSFGVGVDSVSRSTDEDIDAAMWRLLEAIDERFEIDGDPGVPGVGGALLAFDDRRDDLMAVWFP